MDFTLSEPERDLLELGRSYAERERLRKIEYSLMAPSESLPSARRPEYVDTDEIGVYFGSCMLYQLSAIAIHIH